jgi:hypothetical protein
LQREDGKTVLTAGERAVLEKLADLDELEQSHKDGPGLELVQSIPGGWWQGCNRIDGRIGWSLIRNVYISVAGSFDKDTYIIYRINCRGLEALG